MDPCDYFCYCPMPFRVTVTVRCFGSLLVICTVLVTAPATVGANWIVTAARPFGLTLNCPPPELTGNCAAGIATAPVSKTLPAFLIRTVCSFDLLPTRTLPKFIDFGLSLSVPPLCGVGVDVGVGVAVTVGVGVTVGVVDGVGDDVGDGDGVGVAVGEAVGVGSGTI